MVVAPWVRRVDADRADAYANAEPVGAPVRTTPTIVIIGAGASGVLSAAHLARESTAARRRIDIVLVDPGLPGRGIAYSTTDPRHRLNVPARGMSAWAGDPTHFVRWLRRNVAADIDEEAFVPRADYGRYLADVLAGSATPGSGVQIEHIQLRATDLRPQGRRLRVSLSDGTYRAADSVILALGHGEPPTSWVPSGLRHASRFVADPWRASDLPRAAPGEDVVLVGAGLTAVDMALRWMRPGVRVHMVSRHGMVPLPHSEPVQPPADPPAVPTDLDLAGARRLVLGAIRAADGNWRRAIDGLRPVTGKIWAALGDVDQRCFLNTHARRWDRARHRVAPVIGDWLAEHQADGSLALHAGELVDALPYADRIHVRLSDGTAIDAAAVINCAGASAGVAASVDPLVLNLLDSRLAVPDALGLGFRTDGQGRIVAGNGTRPAVWTLGPLRRGELWESTAIPEIRAQAAVLARQLVPALPDPGLRRRPRDTFGLPLSATDSAAARYRSALGRVLRVQSGAGQLVAEAVTLDPGFALGHAVRALLASEGAGEAAEIDVHAALEAAQAPDARADERERRFIEVAAARITDPGPDSAAALLAHIDAYPEDALAVSVAVPTIAFSGATEVPSEAWALIDALAPAYGSHWWYRGMLAFSRQEQGRFAEAADLADRALADEPAAGHAVHAKAHVHYETGDHRAGLLWLDRWITESGPQAAHRAHFSWHAAIHELALGEYEALARRFAAQLAPPAVRGVRALVDSGSLLWKARVGGLPAEPSGVETVLHSVPDRLLAEPPTPFLALHVAVTLAAANDCRGLSRLRRYAERCDVAAFFATIAPLAEALIDMLHGDFEMATNALLALDAEGVDALGGSAAQREIVEDTLIYAAIQAGRYELAFSALERRLDRRESPHDRSRRRVLARQLMRSRATDAAG